MSIKSLNVSNLLVRATQFTANFDANKTSFPSVTNLEFGALASAMTALSEASAAADAARTSAKTTTEIKTALKIDLANQLARLSNKIKAAETPNENQIAVGFVPNKTIRSTVIPMTISDLVAEPKANGTNKLSWSTNGNNYGVSYDVEGRFGDDGDWSLIGATNNRRYKHTGQIPGNYCEYRVITRAAKSSSEPSASVVVYPRMVATPTV